MYPIDPKSEPTTATKQGQMPRHAINAADGIPPIGIGIGFPEPEKGGFAGRYKTESYMAVRLPENQDALELEDEELKDLLDNDSEDE